MARIKCIRIKFSKLEILNIKILHIKILQIPKAYQKAMPGTAHQSSVGGFKSKADCN